LKIEKKKRGTCFPEFKDHYRLNLEHTRSEIFQDTGTKQYLKWSDILSPLLLNIYLHYVLDLWFSRRIKKQSRGEAYYFRFADDFLACFQYKGDAEHFESLLSDRLEGFGLSVAEEKTRCIEFGRILNFRSIRV